MMLLTAAKKFKNLLMVLDEINILRNRHREQRDRWRRWNTGGGGLRLTLASMIMIFLGGFLIQVNEI